MKWTFSFGHVQQSLAGHVRRKQNSVNLDVLIDCTWKRLLLKYKTIVCTNWGQQDFRMFHLQLNHTFLTWYLVLLCCFLLHTICTHSSYF